MPLLVVDDEPTVPQLEIPPLIKELQATIAVIFDEQGYVVDCNRGFYFLVHQDEVPGDHWNIRSYFVQPNFSDFLAIHTEQTNQNNHLVYQGILNIGDMNKSCRSINGSVYHYQSRLLLIGEYDIADIERLSASVVELNNELAQTHRDLVKANRHLKRKEAKITEMMLTDPMTGIPNRRHFDQRSNEEIKRHQRIKQPMCFVMGDIDLFKSVNDTYGHDVGDIVICSFAHVMSNNKRSSDFVARVGGEEFIMLLPHTEILEAQIVIDRIRILFSQQVHENIDHPITASFGITELRAGDCIENLIKRSDQCLYKAKESGRNKAISK